MSRHLERLMLPALLVAICAWLAFDKASLGEWMIDAGTPVEALARGDLSLYFSWHPVLGPLATLYQTPFALLGDDPLSRYRWASFGCLLATAAVAWYLGQTAARKGAGRLTRTAIPVLFLLNPLTLEALHLGHPEEMMTAALAVGAIVLGSEGRSWQAAVFLGLAIATKQWAVMASLPVLMAIPARRIRAAGLTAAVVFVINLPYLIANSGALFNTQHSIVEGGRLSTIWSIWFPLSPPTERYLPAPEITVWVHELPTVIQPYTHYLIVAVTLVIPLAIWAWRGQFGLSPERAIALFALLALLRCIFDPNDNLYYHVPLLAALVTWDALAPGRLPLRSLAGTAVALLFWDWSRHLGDLAVFNAAYVAVMVGAATVIALTLVRGASRQRRLDRAGESLAGA